MKDCKPILRPSPVVALALLAAVALAAPLRLAAQSGATQAVVDRIQRECLRAYTPEMLREMTKGATDEIPGAVDAAPQDQDEFLEQVLELDKGLFYPILLEDLLPAFEAYVKPGTKFLDLGSGDGRAVFLANVLGADATGIEYDGGMVEISRRALDALGELVDRRRVHFVKNDFFQESWSGYDVIYYFDLTSFEHHRLRQKIAQELDPGARLLVGHQRAAFPGLALETTFESVHVYRQPRSSMHDPTMRKRCEAELAEVYGFLEDWYNGAVEAKVGIGRVADVLARSFLHVGADGKTTGRQQLLGNLRRSYGSWRPPGSETPGTGRFRIEHFRNRLIEGPVAIATFEEWREVGGETQGRLSTILFRLEHGQPNGVTWYHLHQTRLPR